MTNRQMTAMIAAAAMLGFVSAADAAPRADAKIEGWSAMENIPAAALLHLAQDMPLSEVAISDQPYCASDAEIAQTLNHDFNESLVDTSGHQGMGTELWGSDQMGTWTLVAARSDDTSCIIASGIGFSTDKDADAFYRVAGLR